MATGIGTVKAREQLRPRHEPYYQKLGAGRYLGYQKLTAASEGSWIARCRNPDTGKQHKKSLGDFSNLPAHQRFDAARGQADDFFIHVGRGGTAAEVRTVRRACERYVEHLRHTKGDKAADDADARFKNYVLNDRELADSEMSKLTPPRIERWRKALRELPTRSGGRRGEKRTASTLNRDMTCFRAALNLAYRDGLVTTDFAWRGKLRPIVNADGRRELYLDRDQRRKFIEKAPADLAQFLHGMALLPLRPGALAALDVGHFDKRLGVLKIGNDKAGSDRRITLPKATAALFEAACKDKPPGTPLLTRADGARWDKDAWKKPVKAAAAAAELPPNTTAYAVRHSTITDLVTAGLDLLTVAQLSGTSVAMIEKHYGHLRADHAAAALAGLAL